MQKTKYVGQRLALLYAQVGCAAFALSLASAAMASGGQSAEVIAADDASSEGAGSGTIIVTGVRGVSARTLANSPTPVDVIDAKELASTGRTGLKEILANVIPSLTMPALGGGGTSASVRPISIRGLSGDYLLVLVNGKRRHTTALINNLSRVSGGSTPVDIDLIPTNAVGRIELLRDGAAAQYGSDAISGVLNIILDDAPQGGAFTATAGQLYEKGAALLQQTLSYGTPLGSGGFVRFAIEGKYHDRADSSAEPVPSVFPLVNGLPDPREGQVNHVVVGGYGRSNRDTIINGSYNAELPLSDALTAYSFSTLSYRNIKDARAAYFAAPTGYGGLVNNNGLAVLPQVYPTGFQTYRRLWEWDFQGTVGLKGDWGAWAYDLSSSYGRDAVKLGAENTLNPSIGPTSPTRFFMGRQKQDLWINNLDVSRSVDIGLVQPVILALGIEQRWEKFRNVAGEPDSYRDGKYVIPKDSTPFGQLYGGRSPSPGLVSFTGTSPADARSISRGNVAAYADVAINLTSRWYVGVAGRLEHYTDSAGDTASGKISTRYEVLPGLALRGGVNSGFRAPSLAQTAFSTTQNTTTIAGNARISTASKFLPVDSAAARALGAQPLKPERSLNVTAGIAFERGPLRLTLDAYHIRVDDRIVKTEFLGTASNGGSAIKAILTANGITGVDSAQFFTNGIDTRTRGIDAVAEYSLKSAPLGTIRFSAAYSYNKTKILDIIANPAPLSSLNVTLFGRQAQQDLLVATPDSKAVLSANWDRSAVHGLIRFTRFGKYTEASTVASGDRTFGAKWVTDLEIGYDLSQHVTLSAGANNAFDIYPNKRGIIAYDGTGAYGNFAPFGLSGGFYYARVGVLL